LAAALDGETARSRRLESTNREIAERLDTAIASIAMVLDLNEVNSWPRSLPPSPAANCLACEDSQEEHLPSLAKDIDQRIISLRRKFGEIGDTRLTVMAALMLADEMNEAMQKVRRLEEDVAALQDARLVAADRAKAASDAVTGAFNSAAERIEGITKKLNQTVGNGSVPIG
jgi:cell division protein ZapA